MAKDREPTIRVEGTSPQLDVIPTDYSKIQKIILAYMEPQGPTFLFTRCYQNANLFYFSKLVSLLMVIVSIG
jgi:hypothetical protein